jgi:hypothetical protein
MARDHGRSRPGGGATTSSVRGSNVVSGVPQAMRSARSQGRWSARNGISSAIQSRTCCTVGGSPGFPTRARVRRSVSRSSDWTQTAASVRCVLSRRPAPTPSMMSSGQSAGTSIAPWRWCSSHRGGRKATGCPACAGSKMPSISKSAQPKRECHHAMSSVCTTADLSMTLCSRAASVVLPLELRPSMTSTTGRWLAPLSWPSCIRSAATVVNSSARHGPASGSSGASCRVTEVSVTHTGRGSHPAAPALSAREVCGAARVLPADSVACGDLDGLSASDRGYP